MLDKLNGFHVDNNLIEIELYNLDLIQDGKFIKLTINNIIEIVKKTDKSKKDNIIIDFIKQILECENNAIYYLNYILNNKEQIDMGVIEKLNSIRPKIINNNFQFYLNYAKVFEKEIDNYGLEDWQKELVRSGQNSSCDFEEEDLEKENFYHEDDKEGR